MVTPIKLARQNFVFAIRRFFRLNRPVAIIFPRRFSDYHLYAILQNFVIAILFIGDFLIITSDIWLTHQCVMGGQSALRVAGFAPDAAYTAACAKLAAVVLSHAPYMPPSGGDDTAVQQAVRHKSHRYSVPWQGGGDSGKLSFMEAAKELPHPSNDHHLSLPADLLELIEWVVRKRESTAEALRKRTRLLADVEESLRPLNARMLATCKPHVYHVVRRYNLAFMACMIDATSFPDVGLVRHFLRGFPTYGALRPCGSFSNGGDPPVKPVGAVRTAASNIAWNLKLYDSVQRRGDSALAHMGRRDTDPNPTLWAVWAKTAQELEDGWSVGVLADASSSKPDYKWRGLSIDELYQHPWVYPQADGSHRGQVRAARRFGTWQKGALRPIDDASESGDNDITGSEDKLTLIRADTPVQVARAFALSRRRWEEDLKRQGRWVSGRGSASSGEREAFEVAQDDCKKAFRRCPVASVMVVCVYNPVTRCSEFIILPCFIFGCYSAVHGWNRYSHFATHCGRRLALVATTGYYDDFQIYGPPWYCASAQDAFGSLLTPLIGFDVAKHELSDQRPVTLGVRCDFSRVPLNGVIWMEVTDERKRKLAVTLDELLGGGAYITHSTASKLYGKARFVICPRFGRIYLAVLQPLHNVKKGAKVKPGSDMHACLTYLRRVVQVLRPVSLAIYPVRVERPVVVFTDASFQRATMTGELGIVVWVPERDMYFYSSSGLPSWIVTLWTGIEERETFISPAEALVAACAYFTFPDLLGGRLVHHFVDNDAAKAGLIKGTSSSPHTSLVLLDYHVVVVELQCDPWVGFVYSEDNLSDPPSRGDFKLMQYLGAEYRPMRFPALRGHHGTPGPEGEFDGGASRAA